MSLWDQDSPFAEGGRQGRGRPGPCAVSKKESNNARFSFASSTSPSSCSKHLDIFSLSIYEGCLSHYSPVMTPNGEAALVKNHRRAHSSPTSLPDSSWNVEPGGAAVLRRLAGSPGVTAPPRCRSVVCDRRTLLDSCAGFPPASSFPCTLHSAQDVFSTLLFPENSYLSMKIKLKCLLQETFPDSPFALLPRCLCLSPLVSPQHLVRLCYGTNPAMLSLPDYE